MSLPRNKAAGLTRLSGLLILLLWVGLLGVVALNRQNLFDWWRLKDYQAPVAVAELASQDGMTAYGRKIYNVNHPLLQAKADFSKACPNNGGEQTIVMGCYHGDQRGIYLLDVSDVRLKGVEQVTAAHEMLHAAYDRLNSRERQRIDALLTDYYDHKLTDQRVRDTIDAYKKTEPKDLVNEMHSVFGTEIASLPSALEAHYKLYFTNRAQVVAFASQYQAEFTSRQATVKQYDAQLAALKAQIESYKSDLANKEAVITSQRQTLDKQRSSGSIEAYNAGVPVYNNLVTQYNREVSQLKSLIAQYNQLVNTRNAVALEEQQLVNELSSNVAPIGH